MRSCALLVIDYIKGIALNKGSCANFLKDHPYVIQNTNKLIACARTKQIPIIHVRLAFDNSYTGLPKYAPSATTIINNQAFQINSEATEFIAGINILPSDLVINKTYGDVFHGNNLLQQLKQSNIEELIFTGISTDNAILNSANTAILNNFYVTVIVDACGAPTVAAHESALAMMKGRTASELMTTSDYLLKQQSA